MNKLRRVQLVVAILIISLLSACQRNPELQQLLQLEVHADADQDGLPDGLELELGTASDRPDTDEDGLSDYLEVRKYRTDPLLPDSDGDGAPDYEWAERREYAYTIQAVLLLRPPFRIPNMNDFYQDARVLETLSDNVTKVEVVLYPEAEAMINPAPYRPELSAAHPDTAPTYTKNYSAAMQASVRQLTKDATTDAQATVRILQQFDKFKTLRPMEDLGYQSALPIHFSIFRDANGQIVERGLAEVTGDYSLDEVKARDLFADSMYQLGVHGACSSSASLRGAMLRAAGLPERTILTIPLIYYYQSDQTEIRLKDELNIGYPNVTGNLIADHFFHEVLLGNQWVRVDYGVDTGILVFGQKPYLKLLTCADQTDFDFTQYWNFDTWQTKRPYQYVSVIEQAAVHQR